MLSGRKRKSASVDSEYVKRIRKTSVMPSMMSFINRPPVYFPPAALPITQSVTNYFPVSVENPSTSSDDNISENSASIARKSPVSLGSGSYKPDLFVLVKPPYAVAGLSVVAYMALGNESVTGWQIGEKLRALFPYWDNGNRICSLLLSITAALTNFRQVFVQDPEKPAHWKINIDAIDESMDILQRHADEDNYLLVGNFVESLFPVIKNFGTTLRDLSSQQIQQLLFCNKPSNDIEDSQNAVIRKTPSDEGYNSPVRKGDGVITPPFSRLPPTSLPQMLQKNVFWMKNMASPFGYPGSLYNPLNLQGLYGMLPFLSQASMHNNLYMQQNVPLMTPPITPEPVSQSDERKYTRHAKPPYSYSSIIMLALLTEETRALPLREIVRR